MSIQQLDNYQQSLNRMEACIADVSKWMKTNILKLNQEKTEMIVFRPKQLDNICTSICLNIGQTVIHPTPHVRNLGIFLDCHLTMEKQVNYISKSCYYQI